MGIWQILIIGIGLSLDVFAYCLYKGAMISEIRKGNLAKLIGIFAGFQMGMVVVGGAITMIPAIRRSYLSANRLWNAIAAVLFLGLGVWMIAKSFRKKYRKIEEQVDDRFNIRVVIFWAFMTSLDALIAGLGFGLLSIELWVLAVMLGVITAATVIAGVFAGYRLGCGPMNRFVTVGGCIVIIGGIDVLARYLSLAF
jgi:putative Mn2+ efflux pump MntP